MNQAQVARIAEIVALVMTQMSGKPVRQPKAAKKAKAKPVYLPKADRQANFANAVIAAFKAKNITVTPNQDVFTYGKWAELGLQPKAGEKATFVKSEGMKGHGIPLFHKGQVEALRSPR